MAEDSNEPISQPPPQDDGTWAELLKEVLRQEGVYLDALKSLTDRASRLATLSWAVFAFSGTAKVFSCLSPTRFAGAPLEGLVCFLALALFSVGAVCLIRVSLFPLPTLAGPDPERLVAEFQARSRADVQREVVCAAKDRVVDLAPKAARLARDHTVGYYTSVFALALLMITFILEAARV